MPFDLSLFKTKSENAIDETILDPDFIVDLEVQHANKSIDEYILKSPQSSINTAMTLELSEQLSITLSSPLFPSTSTIIPYEVHSSHHLYLYSLTNLSVLIHHLVVPVLRPLLHHLQVPQPHISASPNL